jgi:hypothetical protein
MRRGAARGLRVRSTEAASKHTSTPFTLKT